MSRLILFWLLALAVPTFAQETPTSVPFPNGGPVCGPLPMTVACLTWVRFPTPTSGVEFVGRCWIPDLQPWWQPEGPWDRWCHEVAGPGQACIAQARLTGPRSVVCENGLWAP